MSETECPLHPRAARCFHRGESFVVEYCYKNGKWRIHVHDPANKNLDVKVDCARVPRNAADVFEKNVDYLRRERTQLAVPID